MKKVKKVTDYNQQELCTLGETASAMFENRVTNLLACFDAPKVYEAMAALVRLNGLTDELKQDFSVSSLCRATCENFLTLLSRGALDAFHRFPITEEAQTELDALAAACGHGSVPNGTGDSTTIPYSNSNPIASPIEECVRDFRDLGSNAFKQKWMDNPKCRAIYDDAINQGAI